MILSRPSSFYLEIPRLRKARLELALDLGKYDIALAELDQLATDLPSSSPGCYLLRSIIFWVAGKDLGLARADIIGEHIQRDPREWALYAYRTLLDFKQTRYAMALNDIARCALALNCTEFAISWKLENLDDETQRFRIGIVWRPDLEKRGPAKSADSVDLKHKLVDLGLKAVWGSSAPDRNCRSASRTASSTVDDPYSGPYM